MNDDAPAGDPSGDTLRVDSWHDFIGQDRMKTRLAVHIAAALNEGRFLDHVLFAGPPGFGKTSLARILGDEMGAAVQTLTMPVKPKALTALLRQTDWGDIVFFDEIHRAPKSQQEDLLPLLEEGYVQLPGGARLEWGGTIIGATTEPDRLIPPLYDRFPIRPAFEDYTPDQMGAIVAGMAAKAGVDLSPEACVALGQATAGTPRNARSFVKAARDLASTGQPVTVDTVLDLCDTDPDGLSRQHLEYLRVIAGNGGTAGLKVMTTLLRLSDSMVRELERVLIRYGYVQLSGSGRELTNKGWAKTR